MLTVALRFVRRVSRPARLPHRPGSHVRDPTPGGKEGRRQAHKNIMAYRPIYLWEIPVNNLFTVVTSSWDSSPRPVIGCRARGRRAGHPRSGHTK